MHETNRNFSKEKNSISLQIHGFREQNLIIIFNNMHFL